MTPSSPGGDSAGPLSSPIDRKGNLRLGHTLTGEAIRQILSRRTLATGLAAISPHDLRRTYAGDLLGAGADLPAVQQLMGHASRRRRLATTVDAIGPAGPRPSARAWLPGVPASGKGSR